MAEPWQNNILMVIPSLNGGSLLARMLPTLRFKPSNIVILDQGSTDDTASVCADSGAQIVQLGHPHTYTQTCNMGAQIARERGCKYVCVSNNDIMFRTDVLGDLFAEMERDPKLGILAPTQIIIDEVADKQVLSWRVFWSLDEVDFYHDTKPVDPTIVRLEADFCELTCALVRLSAIDEIGFLDDDYGFYHEDADFGFRLWKAGYSCAYLPKTQIDHFSGSTFSREKLTRKASYISKNKKIFAKKHLGYSVNHPFHPRKPVTEWDIINADIHPWLRRYGLLDQTSPDLVVSYPGVESSGYLFTTFESAKVPTRWNKYGKQYQAIFTTSDYMQKKFTECGVVNSYCVPLGVEVDVFHPWGATHRLYDEKSYLSFADGRQSRQLNLILEVWRRFARAGRNVRLVLLGQNLVGCIGRSPDLSYRSDNFIVGHYEAEKVDIYEIVAPLASHERAQFYRSFDYTIASSSGEATNRSVLESLACGIPCIFGHYGPMAELALEGALTFESRSSHIGSGEERSTDPTNQWEPVPEQVVACLEESYQLSASAHGKLAEAGVYKVRSRSTLRHTAFGLYNALTHLQVQNPAAVLKRLEQRQILTMQTIEESDEVVVVPPSGGSGDGHALSMFPAIDRGVAIKGGSWTMRHRLSSMTARRIKTMGRLTSEFGSVWQERGFTTAGGSVLRELRHFVRHRSRQFSWLSHKAIRLTQAKSANAIRQQPAPLEKSALLIGYIDAQLGLGESLRGLALAMSGSAVNFKIYPFGVGVEGRRSVAYMPERYDQAYVHAVNVMEVAPGEVPTVFGHIGGNHFDHSYNILRTYWELSKAPQLWRPFLAKIDEIWAPNAFVADSLRTVFDGPITIVAPCIHLPTLELDGEAYFSLEKGRFYFLFSFDYFSFPQRKNPLAVLYAFREAFPDLSTRVGLIVKSTGMPDHFPDIKEELRAAAKDDGRIEIIDESLTRQEMLALMAATDCYVSLHRSEGFGLGMAEAMALGKIVVGTDYSGSSDFLSEATGYPVPYRLKDVAADEYVHAEGQVWADPDAIAATAAMARAFNNREESAARAGAGQRFVEERYGPLNVSRVVENRLNAIFDGRAKAANSPASKAS